MTEEMVKAYSEAIEQLTGALATFAVITIVQLMSPWAALGKR